MNQKLSFFFLFFLVVSCASHKKNYKELKNFTEKEDYARAIELIKSDEFYPEERSRLLKYLELGTIFYLKGDYYQAFQNFDLASDLSDKLFTVSVSKKITSTVLSDNLDNYYGEKYERSLIRFYQALVHYKLYQTGSYEAYEIKEKEKKDKVS